MNDTVEGKRLRKKAGSENTEEYQCGCQCTGRKRAAN